MTKRTGKKNIRVLVEAVVEVPDNWEQEGSHLIAPNGKHIDFIVGMEYDCDGTPKIAATDKAMERYGCQVLDYLNTGVDGYECQVLDYRNTGVD